MEDCGDFGEEELGLEKVFQEKNMRITKIDWSGKGLGGDPENEKNAYKADLKDLKELWMLGELRELHLHSNNFIGSIPEEWAKLAKLERFSINKCRYVSGGIPYQLMKKRQDLGASFKIDKRMNMERLEFNNREADKRIVLEAWENMGGKEDSLKNPYHNNPDTNDISTWHGVETENGRVISLSWNLDNLKNLSDYTLEDPFVPTGEIPKVLGSLLMLKRLDLGGGSTNTGKLTGKIPKELADLESLEWLGLSGNNLIVSIPSEFSNLKKLRSLYVSDNDPNVGYFPPSLKKWKEQLSAFHSDFKDANEELEKDKKVVMDCWKKMDGKVSKLENFSGDDILNWWNVTVSGEVRAYELRT